MKRMVLFMTLMLGMFLSFTPTADAAGSRVANRRTWVSTGFTVVTPGVYEVYTFGITERVDHWMANERRQQERFLSRSDYADYQFLDAGGSSAGRAFRHKSGTTANGRFTYTSWVQVEVYDWSGNLVELVTRPVSGASGRSMLVSFSIDLGDPTPPPPPPVDPPPPIGAQIRVDNPMSSDLHIVGFRYSREATTADPGGGQDAFGYINPEARGAQPWVMLTSGEVVTNSSGIQISEPLMLGKQYNLELFYGYTDEFTGEPVVVRGESWFNIQLPAVLVIGSGQPDG